MATGPNFPSYACILLEGYSEQADFGVIRSDMDGLAKQRPRWTKPIVTRQATVGVKSLLDRNAFDSWFRNALFSGVGWFTFTDPNDGVAKQGRFVNGDLAWTSPGVVWHAAVQIESIG